MSISICIATCMRPDRLSALLGDLVLLDYLPDDVVVVDNDAQGSARAVIEQWRARNCPFRIHYEIQPVRNIALTRNRTVQLASGEWLAFIDDDERAPPNWLRQLVEAAKNCAADGVLGPVLPRVPDEAPTWIRRGQFYDFPRMGTGEQVPFNRMRFGNIILRGEHLRREPGPFDPDYGLTTGEDADLLIRLANKGTRIVWCDEAIVWEPIERSRLSLQWLLQRALSGGQEFARKTVSGRYGPVAASARAKLFVRSCAQLVVATSAAAVAWPFGRHLAAQWLIKASANLGKLSIFWGWRYHEYAKIS